jgi:primosomal protein N'
MLLVDLNQDKSRENKYFSNTLITKIDEYLENSKKVILYLNKR